MWGCGLIQMVGVVSPGDITWTEICEMTSLKIYNEMCVFSSASSPVSTVTEGVTWKVLNFSPDNSVPYEAILVKPRPSSAPTPLAVFPHGMVCRGISNDVMMMSCVGGPHGVIPADFLVWPLCLAALGTAVLLGKEREGEGAGRVLLGMVVK